MDGTIWGAPWLAAAIVEQAASARIMVVHVDCDRDLDAIRRATTPVLALATTPAQILRALELGAQGVLPSDASPDEITAALADLRIGRTVVHPVAVDRLVAALRTRGTTRHGFALTPREQQVLAALTEGRTTRGIATRLGIGFGTAQTHLKAIYKKLGVGSKAAAAIVALRHQLV